MNNLIDTQEHKGLHNKTILKVAISIIVSLTFDHLTQAIRRLLEKTVIT